MAKLAYKGGDALRKSKFPAWPQYDTKESNALERVLKSGVWGTLGDETKKFEHRFAQYQNSRYAVAVNNGTVSLEIILRALGIGYGDEVIIPPYTFYATASAVIMTGAVPVFTDIENDTYNMDADRLETVITPRTKAVIPVHVAGRPCNMDKIMEIATRHNLYVIEDCAHAHGSEWKGKRVGSYGHAGSFSFQCSKNLNCGEGGIITTSDTAIYENCWSIHNCGRDIHSKIWYEHCNVGTNARMSEWQAAILDAQMDRLDEQIEKRQANADYLNTRLKETGFIETMKDEAGVTRNSNHLFIFKFISEKCKGISRELFIEALKAEGIPCLPGYICLYRQPVFQKEELKKRTGSSIKYNELYLENAEKASYREGVWLTQNLLLGDKKDMDDIADAIIKIGENTNELL